MSQGQTHQAPTQAGISAPCPAKAAPFTHYLEEDANPVLQAA